MKNFFKLIFMLIVLSCTDDTIKDNTEKKSDDVNTKIIQDDDIIKYFESQLDKASVAYPDTVFYSQKELEASSINDFKEHLWNLWKTANQQRLDDSKFKNQISNQGDLLTWDLLNNEKMQIKVFTKGDKPNGNYPFFINLHGGGAYPNVASAWKSKINEGQWYGAMEMSREYSDGSVLYCVPRMADDRIGQWHYKPQILAFKRIIQLGIINDIINPNKVYVVGGSQGGYGVIKLSKFMPDYFAGVSAFAAADEPTMLENIQNIAFQMRVGEKDYEYGRVQNAYEWQDKLASLQLDANQLYKHNVTIESGKGHAEIDYNVMTTWLKGVERNISLSNISYTYHNMVDNNEKYGLYSDGVYFLDFRSLKRNSNSDKVFIQVQRSENRIDVKTNKLVGDVSGDLGVYVNGSSMHGNTVVFLNDKKVEFKLVKNSKAVMIESLALWGDPNRIYNSKITIKII